MGDVFLRFCQPVLAGDTALAQFDTKGMVIQRRQSRGLGKGQPTPSVVAAGKFNLHMPLPLSKPQRTSW
jgi:hypothetical protein